MTQTDIFCGTALYCDYRILHRPAVRRPPNLQQAPDRARQQPLVLDLRTMLLQVHPHRTEEVR